MCVEPHIDDYKKAVDKINRDAEKVYSEHKKDYYLTTFGIGTLPTLFSAAKSDLPIGFKVRTDIPPKRVLGNPNRAMFYATFFVASIIYIEKRVIALQTQTDEFVEATVKFFNKVSECRKKHPYDMLIQMSPSDEQVKEFLDSIKNPPTRRDYLKL